MKSRSPERWLSIRVGATDHSTMKREKKWYFKEWRLDNLFI